MQNINKTTEVKGKQYPEAVGPFEEVNLALLVTNPAVLSSLF